MKKLMSMSSAGIIAGRSPCALLGVKGAGLGRRGGVPGAWPFMMLSASTAFGVKTGSSLAGVLVAAGRALAVAAWTMGLGLCKNKFAGARRAVGAEFRPPAKLLEFVLASVLHAASSLVLLEIWAALACAGSPKCNSNWRKRDAR